MERLRGLVDLVGRRPVEAAHLWQRGRFQVRWGVPSVLAMSPPNDRDRSGHDEQGPGGSGRPAGIDDDHGPSHSHSHSHDDGHGHGDPGHGHAAGVTPDGKDWADVLDALVVDGELAGPVFEAAMVAAAAAGAEAAAVRRVLDLGSGAGVATLELARRFPNARVTAVDVSAGLLASIEERAAAEDLAERVDTVEANLDDGLRGALLGQPVDLVWSSMALHHVAGIDALLAELADGLAQGGMVVLSEFGEPLSTLPADDPLVVDGTYGRWQAAMAAAIDAHLPGGIALDWPALLAGAGLDLVHHVEVPVVVEPPLVERHRAWLVDHLARVRAVVERMGDADRVALDGLLAHGSTGSIDLREDLAIRYSRQVYVARRPA